ARRAHREFVLTRLDLRRLERKSLRSELRSRYPRAADSCGGLHRGDVLSQKARLPASRTDTLDSERRTRNKRDRQRLGRPWPAPRPVAAVAVARLAPGGARWGPAMNRRQRMRARPGSSPPGPPPLLGGDRIRTAARHVRWSPAGIRRRSPHFRKQP